MIIYLQCSACLHEIKFTRPVPRFDKPISKAPRVLTNIEELESEIAINYVISVKFDETCTECKTRWKNFVSCLDKQIYEVFAYLDSYSIRNKQYLATYGYFAHDLSFKYINLESYEYINQEIFFDSIKHGSIIFTKNVDYLMPLLFQHSYSMKKIELLINFLSDHYVIEKCGISTKPAIK
jgi:hypothetical protein